MQQVSCHMANRHPHASPLHGLGSQSAPTFPVNCPLISTNLPRSFPNIPTQPATADPVAPMLTHSSQLEPTSPPATSSNAGSWLF